ncbi:MAG: CDP-diacylglycerol--glycerol-3-phosphate 3-phosphatidyltransferase [Clostridia bacterium]|nr:CDP-diacylglycerol--glycerol-3-phosphate 3-phosphatidyltransferase [Clostridia bacterium]
MQKKYIPNLLSIVRLCLVPVFIYMFFLDYPNNIWYAVLIFFIAGATDVVDGWLARKNNWVTNVGKILDPLADKMMQCTALVCFYIKSIIPLWLPLIYITKELLIAAGAIFVFRKKSVVVKSSFWGKFAVCVFYLSIAVLVSLQGASENVRNVWTVAICVVMLCFAVVALVQYFREYIRAKFTK